MAKQYDTTVSGVMNWARNELEHVGYLIAVRDPDIQYAYAQSTVNGMLHLRDALYQMVNDPNYQHQRVDLLKTHDQVVRTVKHLIADFHVKISEIKRFDTHRVLGKLNYLGKTRKQRK
jgi:hypothetical protein